MAKVSYKAKIMNASHILDETVACYRDAIGYIENVVLAHYEELSAINGDFASNARRAKIESLIHTTNKNKALYKGFDLRFYKFPSYLRRDAITTAYGNVDAYMKLVKLWEKEGCKGKRPHLAQTKACMPCFYRGNSFIENPDDHLFYEKDDDTYMIKVRHRNDWVWIPVVLRETDIRYMKDHCADLKCHAPVLVKQYRNYYLSFCYDVPKSSKTFAKDNDVNKAVGVDLGVNTDAVCSAVTKEGTVTGRTFINHPVEKDRLGKLLNVIKSSQKNGNYKNRRLWRFVDNYSEAIAIDTARRIVLFAIKQEADIIVFEHLSITGKLRGSKAQRIALWRKRDIQKRTEAMAARHGIRVTYVCAAGTSKYAYDGSGPVTRDEKNYSLCTFTSGKRYNCDLSASYNIASRFFIRVLLKTLDEKTRLQAEAKDPSLCRRTTCTLSTLIRLCTVLSGLPGDTETACTGGGAIPAA